MNVDQFFGIEIEEFPAQIAQVALWLMDHQMNLLVSEEFGLYFVRIPLQDQQPRLSAAMRCELTGKTVVPADGMSVTSWAIRRLWAQKFHE